MWPRRLGVLLFGRPASATTGPGHPDLFGIARGQFLALEIKKARAKATDLQIQRLRDLRDCGAYAWIVRTEEQACYAVYWAVKGWTRPLSNEPLDLSDWLLGDDAKPQPAQAFAPNAQEPIPFEPGGGRARGEDDTFAVPVPPQPEAELFDLGEVEITPPVLASEEVFPPEGERYGETAGMTHESVLQDLDARDDTLNGAFPEDNNPEDIGHEATEPDIRKVDSAYELEGAITLANLQADLRTVGDRVTLVYERVDHFLAVLVAVDQKLNRLLALVEEEPSNGEVVEVEVPEKPKRTRRKKTEAPAPEPEPEPAASIIDTIDFNLPA